MSVIPPEVADSRRAPTTTALGSADSADKAPGWGKTDTIWTLSLFGTAIGAGVMFLPINAGIGGIIPLITMTIIAFPMTFWDHRAMTRLGLSGSDPKSHLTDVMEEHFGANAGVVMSVLYFVAVYPLVLVYAVTLTNTLESFLIHQLHVDPWPRWVLATLLVGGPIFVVKMGQEIVVKVMSALAFPFIAVLIFLTLYLIPRWNTTLFSTFDLDVAREASGNGLATTLMLLVPVMVFSFNHSPIISSFASEKRQEYGDKWADKKTGQVLAAAEGLMVIVVMFFVFSCALSLSPENLAEAKEQNITILSYLANHFDAPFLQWVAPIVALVAICKSFLGHYLGAADSVEGLVVTGNHVAGNTKFTHSRALETGSLIFILVTCILVAWADPSILGMIETLCGPAIAVLLFLIPMWAIHKVDALKRFRGKPSNWFTTFIGLVAVATIFFSIFHSL